MPDSSCFVPRPHPRSSPHSWRCGRGREDEKTLECENLPLWPTPAACHRRNRSLGLLGDWKEWSPISGRESILLRVTCAFFTYRDFLCTGDFSVGILTFGCGPNGSATSPKIDTDVIRRDRMYCFIFTYNCWLEVMVKFDCTKSYTVFGRMHFACLYVNSP